MFAYPDSSVFCWKAAHKSVYTLCSRYGCDTHLSLSLQVQCPEYFFASKLSEEVRLLDLWWMPG